MDRALTIRVALVAAARIALLGVWFVVLVRTYAALGHAPEGLAEAAAIALSLAAIKAITGALGDPLDSEALRRLPLLSRENPEAFRARLADRLRMRFAAAGMVGGIGAATALIVFAAGSPAMAGLMMFVGIAAGAELAYRGFTAAAQAREDFRKLVLLEGGLQAVRALLLGIIVWSGWLDARTFLAAYAASAAIIVFLAWEPRLALLHPDPDSRAETVDALRYLRWTVPAMALAAVVERLDVFLLGALKGSAETGPYGAILPLVMIPEVVAGFAMTVLQPRIPVYAAEGRLLAFWRSVTLLTLPLCLCGFLIVLVFADAIVAATVGPAYAAAAPALVILSAGTLVWLAVAPVAQGFIVMLHPRATLLLCLAQAIGSLTLALALIPPFGLVGAAVSAASVKIAVALALCVAALALAGRANAAGAAARA
jgi:O-antigen/teichoic acid export membrane protein